MPRPKTKIELLNISKLNFDKLNDYIDSLSKEQLQTEFPSGTLNRNIRDVIAHLHHWNKLLLSWYDVGLSGEKPPMPAKGYTWKTLPEFNRKVQEQWSNTALYEARELFKQSFLELRKIIKSHTQEDLFEKKKYKWTGTTSMAAYFISATSSHYDWALKLIKKCLKG